MKLVVSHPTANANVRALVSGFLEAEMLEKFFTTTAYFPNSFWQKLGIKDLDKRRFDKRLKPYTITHPLREVARIITGKTSLSYLTLKESSPLSIDAVYKSLDKYVCKKLQSLKGIEGVYGYEDGSYYSFQKAKEIQLKTIYELPIAYWQTARKLLNEEAERCPEWHITLGGGITDSEEKLQRKTIELELADIIITPSKFVADSLPDHINKSKVIIVPFGTPGSSSFTVNKATNKHKPLRILFAGALTQRKGLADLFKAVKLLHTKHVELIVLGALIDDLVFYKKKLPTFTYEPPRVHQEVLNFMETCDILCLPSIVEGRALVMQEAMSRCLPLIITPNTGGEDLITNETGFLVPIRSPETIAEKINWFLDNRSLIKEMGRAASNHALKYTWNKYSTSIIQTLKD